VVESTVVYYRTVPFALTRAVAAALVRSKLKACASVGASPRVLGRVWIHGGGSVRLGSRVFLNAAVVPIELHAHAGGEIVIGDDVTIESGASIEADRSVVVGARSRLGSFCKLVDTNFHQLTGDRSVRPRGVQVTIEEDVAIGPRAIVLPGAFVGRAAVIAAGTVLSRPVPAGAVAAGLPAVIR
jgi:acetyltransferase-like isoleucine patch superfamily enzyme